MLAFLLAFVGMQSCAVPDPPPEPDFITVVGYVGWFEKQIKGNCRDADNAGPLYRKILGDPPVFGVHEPFPLGGGPRWNTNNRPRAWNPAEHPDWEEAYERRRPLMDLYRDAARKPYVLFERGSPVDAEGKPLIRWFTDPYCRYYWPGLPSCASDHAWRGVDGTPDIDVLIDLAGANLGLSRQLARDATILSLFRTVRARWIAYDDLTTALKRGLLSEAQRARCRQLLRALDPPVPTLQAIARFELAEHYDCLQVQAHEDLGSTAADIARGRFHLPFPDRTKLIASRDEAREFYGGLERLSLVPWTPQLNADIEQLKRACVRPGSHGFMAANSSVTGALQIFVRSEAERRATRLIFEIHVHRDETGAWPATLSELKGVPEEFKTDPFFGRRFIYKPVGDSFQLYSVSIDGRDNNGLHDGRWGRKIADSDYVFWPMPD